MVWPFSRLTVTRSNATKTLNVHAADHNAINEAANQIRTIIGDNPTGPFTSGGATYESIQEVLAALFALVDAQNERIDGVKDFVRIRTGSTNPSAGLGNVGDIYVNAANPRLFGPKTAQGWGAGVSLVGPRGLDGAAGPSGSDGGSGGGTGGSTSNHALGLTRAPTPADGVDGNVWTMVGPMGLAHYYRRNGVWLGPIYDAGSGPGTEPAAPTLSAGMLDEGTRVYSFTISDTIPSRRYVLRLDGVETMTEYPAPGPVSYTVPAGKLSGSITVVALDAQGRESLPSNALTFSFPGAFELVLGLVSDRQASSNEDRLLAFQIGPDTWNVGADAGVGIGGDADRSIRLYRDGVLISTTAPDAMGYAEGLVYDPEGSGGTLPQATGLPTGVSHTWYAETVNPDGSVEATSGPLTYTTGAGGFRSLALVDSDVSGFPPPASPDARTVSMSFPPPELSPETRVRLYRDSVVVRDFLVSEDTVLNAGNTVILDGDPMAAGVLEPFEYLIFGDRHTWQLQLDDGPVGAPLSFTVGQ